MLKIYQFIDNKLNKNQQELKHLTRRLHNCLPFQLIPHVQITTQKKGSITVLAANQSIAQKLRYCTRDIKKSLAVQHVHIVINSAIHSQHKNSPKTIRRPIGAIGKQSIADAANSIQHEGIQYVLRKLSS